MYYHLDLDSAWKTNYLTWGVVEMESVLANTLDRVREFIKEWEEERPLYTSQLEQLWKVHKGEYLDRVGIVPKRLQPEQQSQ